MKVKNQIPSAIIAAATGMLREYVPTLTPVALVSALEEYQESKRHIETRPRRPYTVPEAMELLVVSKPTLYRMFEDGTLSKIKVRGLTRIAAEEIENLLAGNASVNAEND